MAVSAEKQRTLKKNANTWRKQVDLKMRRASAAFSGALREYGGLPKCAPSTSVVGCSLSVDDVITEPNKNKERDQAANK